VRRILIVGNSGSGKSTLARQLAPPRAHLDLDVLAWLPTQPVTRRQVHDSLAVVSAFISANASWVIEGCYADLVEPLLSRCDQLVYLNPGREVCLAHARARPWEPHKYATPEAQQANLPMLLAWIAEYETRTDVCSASAHRALFEGFDGQKVVLVSPDEIRRFAEQAEGLLSSP
jgi:adenylate kinase family enzyme